MEHRIYSNQYYETNSIDSAVAAVLSIYVIIVGLIVIFSLLGYILHSFGMYTIAKRLGRTSPWIAFIPFARNYLHGELAGEIILKKNRIKNPGIWNLIIPFACGIIFFAFYIIFLVVFFIGVVSNIDVYGGNVEVGVGTIMGIIFFFLIWLLVMAVCIIAYRLLRIMIDMQIYRRFTTQNMAIVHAVLSALIPFYRSICTFILQDKPFVSGQGPQPMPEGPRPMPPEPAVKDNTDLQ